MGCGVLISERRIDRVARAQRLALGIALLREPPIESEVLSFACARLARAERCPRAALARGRTAAAAPHTPPLPRRATRATSRPPRPPTSITIARNRPATLARLCHPRLRVVRTTGTPQVSSRGSASSGARWRRRVSDETPRRAREGYRGSWARVRRSDARARGCCAAGHAAWNVERVAKARGSSPLGLMSGEISRATTIHRRVLTACGHSQSGQ